MAKQPTKVEIRSYQVGFGDCFLLTFVYDAGNKHVLIDFGTTGLPRKKKPKEHMPIVAAAIRSQIGTGELTAVVATHRHADHISGFGTDGKNGGSGTIIKNLKPRLVLQPWTEDPKAARDARSATAPDGKNLRKDFIATLATMNGIAQQAKSLADARPAWLSATALKELSFLGEDNIANKSAVENLIAMGSASGAKARYLRYGDKIDLTTLLPGVKLHVLGPPDLTQSEAIRTQRSKDQDEFWHLARGIVPPRAPVKKSSAKSGKKVVPAEARWFRDRLLNMTEKGLLEIVRQLDAQMNNTSLILLFEVNGKKLLFPGDAQLENWSYVLKEAPNSAKMRALLEQVDFYKVGHHGSLNATPRESLWEKFKKREGRKLETMMSTMAGKHGKTTSKTEVPRRTLKDALVKESQLKNTQSLKAPELALLTEL
jgi:hypothetical protein